MRQPGSNATKEPRRLPVLVAGVTLVAAAAAFTGTSTHRSPAAGAVPAVALSSSWSCAGGTAGRGSLAAGQLLIDNAGAADLHASVRLVAENGQALSVGVSVPAGKGVTVPEKLPGPAAGEWTGALVQLYGGMGSVYQEVSTHQGFSVAACEPSASPEWYFAGGSVLRNAALELSLVNPYPQAAVVDVSFATNEGDEQPLAFQGVVVPARGLSVLNVAAALRQRLDIATTVTARTGEVAAWETQRVAPPPAGAPLAGTPGALNPVLRVPGVALTLGARAGSHQWWWAGGGEGAGLTETYQVYNPGTAPAHVVLQLLPGGKGTGSSYSWTVGPDSLSAVTTNGQPWALPGITYAARVASTAPVVAVRAVQDDIPRTGPPSSGRGISFEAGEVQPAQRWLVASGGRVATFSARGASVSVYERLGGQLLRTLGARLAPSQHTFFPLPGVSHALLVEGSAPLMVSGTAVALGAS
jgi:hypothetical protein